MVCECGQEPVVQGDYRVCVNPACDGYGQVCGPADKLVRDQGAGDDVEEPQTSAHERADVRHVDEDGLGWRPVEGEPGSFEIVDTNKQPNEGGEMSGTTLTKEAQASGRSRAKDGAAKDSKAEAKPATTKTRVAVREIPEEYIATVVAGVKAGKKYSDIEKEMIEAKVKKPKGYKTHYPAIRSAAIRHFGSVAEARAAAGKKNA